MKRSSAILRLVLTLLMVTASGRGLLAQSASFYNGATRDGAMANHGEAFANLDQIMNAAVARGTIPGGVVLVGHDGQVVYRKAFGMRSLEPAREAMTVDTIFDIASMTKCIATATSVMKLVQEGKLRLNDPVAAYLPEFARNGKENITIRELLTHFSGLPEDLDLKTRVEGAQRRLPDGDGRTSPIFPPGSRFLYSDINFETLGFVVEKVSGLSLDEYAARNIFEPLGMNDTRFLPPAAWRAAHCAHRIRREPPDAARHGARSHGAAHGRRCRTRGAVLDRRRSGQICAGDADRLPCAFGADGGEDVDAATAAHRVGRCAVWAGISIRRFPAIAESFFRWARLDTPASPEHRYGSIR